MEKGDGPSTTEVVQSSWLSLRDVFLVRLKSKLVIPAAQSQPVDLSTVSRRINSFKTTKVGSLPLQK